MENEQELRKARELSEKRNDLAAGKQPESGETDIDSITSVPTPNEDIEITNNDGSVLETLDTAFHGTPGFTDPDTTEGSNRADFYERRDDGMSDTEEETAFLKRRLQQGGGEG